MKKYTSGQWLNDVLGLNAAHALNREDGVWYHHLERFPGILFDANGYLVVMSKNEYENNPHFRRTKALVVKNGISNLAGYVPFTEDQKRVLLIDSLNEDITTEEQTTRRLRQCEIISRNRKLIVNLKTKYQNTCQLCGLKLKIRKNVYYSEIHHIKPLGTPHNGPDNYQNMICVCPNCHVQLDLGARTLDLNDLLYSKHLLHDEFLIYHNSVIFNYDLK